MGVRRCVVAILVGLLSACGNGEPEPPIPSESGDCAPGEEPKKDNRIARVLQDFILISFKGADDRYPSSRTKAQAEKLAKDLLERIRSGIDFGALKKEFTDARRENGLPERAYYVCNQGVKHVARPDGVGEVPWEACYAVPRKVLFSLEPGEVGLAEYNAKACPQGWLLIKRLR